MFLCRRDLFCTRMFRPGSSGLRWHSGSPSLSLVLRSHHRSTIELEFPLVSDARHHEYFFAVLSTAQNADQLGGDASNGTSSGRTVCVVRAASESFSLRGLPPRFYAENPCLLPFTAPRLVDDAESRCRSIVSDAGCLWCRFRKAQVQQFEGAMAHFPYPPVKAR